MLLDLRARKGRGGAPPDLQANTSRQEEGRQEGRGGVGSHGRGGEGWGAAVPMRPPYASATERGEEEESDRCEGEERCAREGDGHRP